ncbi:YlxR family protein [Tumidithrix helvetica]|uniref:YlxR family protein n=1 Tax=Tumidithrix helvetica TaxID=3457545 RepID=UPI003CC54DAA
MTLEPQLKSQRKLQRCCVSCRKIAPKSEFWRVVRLHSDSPEASATNPEIGLDKGMGRSAYICPNLQCLQQAQKKNRLGRSLHAQIPPQIFELLKARLEVVP